MKRHSFESRGRRKTEVLNVIANVLSLTEEERVSLGLLSAWEVQLKHMMGGAAAGSEHTSPKAATQGCASSSPKATSPQKSEHGSTLSEAATAEAEPGGGFADLWATFLRTDV